MKITSFASNCVDIPLRPIITSIICILLASCLRRHSDPRLDRVSSLIEASPAIALDSLEADPTLRRRILSQTGRLLDSMSLFDEVIPYIEAAINEKTSVEDTISLIYNLQLLGAINLRAQNYVEAESCFKKAEANRIKRQI